MSPNLIKYRKWLYIISLLIIIPGIISLIFWRLKPSIDFTGGTLIEIKGTKDKNAVLDLTNQNKFENIVFTPTENGFLIRSKPITEEQQKNFKDGLDKIKGAQQIRLETVGPLISKEITQRAFGSIALASLVIIVYIGYSFRRVPFPANSWRFGVAAILALLHDTLVVIGIFSLIGHFYNVEVDPLFVTALLTVIGFSVHDTIVIFDRIRENLIKRGAENFESIVNRSIVEMLPRTITTSFLVWIILLILYLFGGITIKYFVLTLVIGIFVGTYSSIFTASPLLVTWQNWKTKRTTVVNK